MKKTMIRMAGRWLMLCAGLSAGLAIGNTNPAHTTSSCTSALGQCNTSPVVVRQKSSQSSALKTAVTRFSKGGANLRQQVQLQTNGNKN